MICSGLQVRKESLVIQFSCIYTGPVTHNKVNITHEASEFIVLISLCLFYLFSYFSGF